MAPRGIVPNIDRLPRGQRDQLVSDIIMGRKTQYAVAQELGISDQSVSRYMSKIGEEERLAIIGNSLYAAKVREAEKNAELVNELGDDIQGDVKWLLRELKSLLQTSKGDEDRILQLGTLKELRQALLALADLQGKLSKKIEVTFDLHESPAFLELRRVMMEVLENHPEAKADFLEKVGALKVINPPDPKIKLPR